MQELRDRVRVVDASEIGAGEIRATVRRAELEDVLSAKDGEPELVIDVTRVGEADAHTLRLACDPGELEKLLRQGDGDNITLALDESSLERALEDDVAAHGLRERVAVLAVAATTAAAGASIAQGAVYQASGGSATATTQAATSGPVTEREWPVGPAAQAPAEAPAPTNQGVVSEREWPVGAAAEAPTPAPTNQGVVSEREWPVGVQESAAADSGVVSEREWPVAVGGTAAQAPSPTSATDSASAGPDAATAAAVAGGAALLISAAGFAVRRQRKAEPRPV